MSTAEERLKRVDAALAAQLSASIARNSLLQAQIEQIRQVCVDNAGDACDHKMALDFVYQITIRQK